MALNNTATRIIVSIVAIPAIVAVTYFGKIPFLIFVLAISLMAFYEFHLMLKNKNSNVNLLLGFIAVAFLIVNQYYLIINSYDFLIIWFALLLLIELFRNKNSALSNLGGTALSVLFLGLFGSSLIGIREFYSIDSEFYINGGYLIISIMATIWICDSAAFFGGTALGKHKLFPRVSPNKSWEGAIFGFIFAIITMAAAKFIVLDFLEWKDVIAIGLIVGIIGQIGDLVESLIKRDAGVKDSSALIPGHGGIFDRFDSLLFSSPVIYFYLTYFL
jgi:phosphatidate cytidylyltransferase